MGDASVLSAVEGGRRRRRRKWWRAHTIENLSRRGTATRQIQRSKWRFYANRGFHFSSHRPSAILCFHSFSPLPSFFFSSLLTAHFCHACGANRRPPSQRPPFLIYRERTWGERRGGESHLSAISRIRCGWSAVINLVTDLSFSLFVGFQIRLI